MTTFAHRSRADVLRDVAEIFRVSGCESPMTDARLLMAHALAVEPLALVVDREQPLTGDEAARLAACVARRLAHEPVSRIIGERWFYGRPFAVSPDTLDPRPDSEVLVDAVLGLVRERGWPAPRFLDIGTGTGCLLVSLLAEWPAASGIGTDISPAALEQARHNAEVHGVAARVEWRHGADFGPILGSERRTFNVILSNPPYIPTGDIDGLAADVRDYDPRTALDGGPDGLAVYRRLCDGVSSVLSDGWIVFEVGAGQADDVIGLLGRAFGRTRLDVRCFRDLAGVDRCVAVSPRH